MVNTILGFLELGVIILAWMVVWSFIVKGFTGIHGDSPAAQGFAALFHA